MDKITAKGMRFFGCHGVEEREKTNPQPFIIDCELWLNLRPAGLSNELIDTVNYAEMYQLIKEIIENQCFNLLEALAENIAAVLLKTYKPEKVVITVAKPQPPLLGKFDYFSVTIERW